MKQSFKERAVALLEKGHQHRCELMEEKHTENYALCSCYLVQEDQLGAGQVLGEVLCIHLLSFPRYKLVLEKGPRQEGPLGWCYHCSQTRQISDSEVPHSIGRSRSPCATIKLGPVGQHSLREGLLVFSAWAGLEGKAAGAHHTFTPDSTFILWCCRSMDQGKPKTKLLR